jgi:predicted Zn-dependent protease
MRRLGPVLVIAATLSMLAGARVCPAEPEVNFRQRMSSTDEVVTSDVAEEVRFGREVAARVIARFGLYENPGIMKYVNLVGQALSQSTNRPEIEFRFAVLNTDAINAYAAPGGYVFVTRGSLAAMRDEAELAGVLAHEIAHIVERHAVKEFNIKGAEDSISAGMAHAIGGSSESARLAFSQAVDKALDLLLKDGYKREDEIQADNDSVLFCALSGYDPSGLVRYFERIRAMKGKLTEVLDRTHPSYDTRIAWLKGTMTREGIDPETFKTYKERFVENMGQLK